MLAPSHPASVLWTVNNTIPPGRICGHRWAASPCASSVAGVGAPPAELIHDRAPAALRAATMLPSSPQLPPRPLEASQSVIAAPPSTLFSVFPARKMQPIARPVIGKERTPPPCPEVLPPWPDRAAA